MGRGGSGLSKGGGSGLKPSDIKSEKDMISERGNAKLAVDDTLTVARNVVDRYGEEYAVKQLMISDVKDGVLGYYRRDDNIVALSDKYMDRKKMNTTYDAGVKDGFHPSRGDKSGVEAVMAHEYGHAIQDKVARKMGMSMEDSAAEIVKNARKNLKGNDGKPLHSNTKQMASAISGYANYNYKETIAEAFADVYCNGRNGAKRESMAIVTTMEGYM